MSDLTTLFTEPAGRNRTAFAACSSPLAAGFLKNLRLLGQNWLCLEGDSDFK